MTVETKVAPGSPVELLGDPHPLLEQLGGVADDLAVTDAVARAVEFRSVTDLPSLRRFLDSYRAEILVPIELPIIGGAYGCAGRGEACELIALDERLSQERTIRSFAQASCRVGQRQLSKLRPLRGQRVVQRYLAAIEEGRAKGWHTIVYGVSLAMFSLPLRQGLQNYADQTMRGFIESAARSLRLPESDCESLLAAQVAQTPAAINAALSTSSPLLIT